MDKIVMSALTTLSKSVEATDISADCKHTIAWCLGKLPPLYANYQSSYESRYGDEIKRLVQTLIQQLTATTDGCEQAYQLGTGMAERFQVLHERLNLPALILKSPPALVVTRVRRVAIQPQPAVAEVRPVGNRPATAVARRPAAARAKPAVAKRKAK